MTKVHPVFLIGIMLVAAPAITPLIGFKLWSWIGGVGILLILIGAGLTAFSND